jgi:hypothetical protein
MRVPWKLLGLAGVAGVAAGGVVVARKRRTHTEYDPEELRERLHQRLGEVNARGAAAVDAADPGAHASAPESAAGAGGEAQPGH